MWLTRMCRPGTGITRSNVGPASWPVPLSPLPAGPEQLPYPPDEACRERQQSQANQPQKQLLAPITRAHLWEETETLVHQVSETRRRDHDKQPHSHPGAEHHEIDQYSSQCTKHACSFCRG